MAPDKPIQAINEYVARLEHEYRMRGMGEEALPKIGEENKDHPEVVARVEEVLRIRREREQETRNAVSGMPLHRQKSVVGSVSPNRKS